MNIFINNVIPNQPTKYIIDSHQISQQIDNLFKLDFKNYTSDYLL